MKFYCGIDLSARDCQLCVMDEQLKIMVQQKLRSDLAKVCQLLEANGFMVSPLGCLVKFTHPRNSG